MTSLSNTSKIAAMAIMSLVLCVGMKAQNQIANIDATNLNSIVRYMPQGGGYDYTYGGIYGYSIGRADGTNGNYSGSQEDLYVCQRQFDLSVLPVNATVVNVTLTVGFGNYTNGTYQATVVSLSSIRSYGQGWGDVWSGSAYFQNIPYGSPQPQSSSTFTNAVRNAGRGYFYVGLKGQSGTNGSYATLTQARLTIEYTPPVQVTVRTNLPGNSAVKVDGGSYSSPASFSWVSGSSHTLESTSQPPNTFQTWFNVTAGQPISGNPISVSPTSNTIYEARYDVNYQVTVHNSFGSGFVTVDGNQYASGAQFIWSAGSQHTLLATNQQHSDYLRAFCNWTLPSGNSDPSNPLPVTASQSGPYTAQMWRQFDVAVTQAQYIEPGSGGTYKVNGTNVGSTWQGAYVENCSSPITLEAVPPTGWVFVRWSDGNTQNPRILTPTDHVENLTAQFKGHLRAQSPFATGPSSQRKVIHAAGVTHAVYESGGSIWYTRNDGTGWSGEIPIWISSTARNPSIGYSTTSGTYLQIVWTDQVGGNPSNWGTYYKLSTNLGLAWWTEPMVLAGPFSEPTNPIVCSGYYSAVIWRGWDGLKIMHDPWRTPSWQYYTISHTGGTARDFSTTQRFDGTSIYYDLAFVKGGAGSGEVFYQQVRYASVQGQWVWVFPSPLSLSSGYEWMSDGANTSIANSDGQLFVAWDALDARSGIPTRSVFVRERRADQSWTPAVAFSHCSHQSSSPVVGIWTYNGANVLDLLWQCGNHVARGTRLVANPLWSPVSNLGPGNGPTIIGSMLSSGSILGGWMTGTSAPYVINFQQLPPPQFERWNAGWNVAGIAVRVPNYNRSTVFPDAIGPIYKFVNGQYQPASDPLDSNRGYWVQFPSTQPTWPISYNGTHIDSMAMPVQSGWNIIGSISVPIDTLVVTSIPTGIRISPFWKYQPGYAIADKLNPGMGYWVKSSNNGHLILKNGAACPFVFQTPKDKFTITDSEGYQQELYVVNGEISENAENIEMPPTPPEAEFDVRWESGDYQIVVEPTGEPIELPIDLNAVSFPITLEWELDPENGLEYAFIPSGGLGKAPAQLTGTGRLTVPLRVHKIRLVANGGTSSGVPVLPTAYALGQNYPNPFNPTTTLRYDLPEDATVSLRVYDVLGREVAVLADGVKSAGYHAAIFDGSGIASGVYLARFTASDAAGVLRYTHTTKLLLTK